MYCNARARLHSGGSTYDFNSVYVYETTTSGITTAGMTRATSTMLYIPQDLTGYNLSLIPISVGKDYFTINGKDRKYTIKNVINGLYGSPGMNHLEFELT